MCSNFEGQIFPKLILSSCNSENGISYTWRSILKGMAILKEGMLWRLGDGEGIDIWHDPWIPKEHTRKPITPRGSNQLRYVSELINPIGTVVIGIPSWF
jgi:hypothetical protein